MGPNISLVELRKPRPMAAVLVSRCLFCEILERIQCFLAGLVVEVRLKTDYKLVHSYFSDYSD